MQKLLWQGYLKNPKGSIPVLVKKKITIIALLVAVIILSPTVFVFVHDMQNTETVNFTGTPVHLSVVHTGSSNYGLAGNFLGITNTSSAASTSIIKTSTIFYNNSDMRSYLNMSVQGWCFGVFKSSVHLDYKLNFSGSVTQDLLPENVTVNVSYPLINYQPLFYQDVSGDTIWNFSNITYPVTNPLTGLGTFALNNQSNLSGSQRYHFNSHDTGYNEFEIQNNETYEVVFTISLGVYSRPVTASIYLFLTQMD